MIAWFAEFKVLFEINPSAGEQKINEFERKSILSFGGGSKSHKKFIKIQKNRNVNQSDYIHEQNPFSDRQFLWQQSKFTPRTFLNLKIPFIYRISNNINLHKNSALNISSKNIFQTINNTRIFNSIDENINRNIDVSLTIFIISDREKTSWTKGKKKKVFQCALCIHFHNLNKSDFPSEKRNKINWFFLEYFPWRENNMILLYLLLKAH